MKNNKISIEINKPIDEVFEFTINPNNTPLWINSIVEEKTSEWPIQIDSNYVNTDTEGKTQTYSVSAYEKNNIFELSTKNGYHVRYSYEEISPTKTFVEYWEWVDNGILENPFEISVLENLKSILENN